MLYLISFHIAECVYENGTKIPFSVPPKYPLACQTWGTDFNNNKGYPTRDYSQAIKDVRCGVSQCFAVFNGNKWQGIKACDSPKLKFDFESGYCLCESKTQLFRGEGCSEENYDDDSESDILNHFYQQQFIYANGDDPSSEVKQSFANLHVLRGDYPNNTDDISYPQIYFTNNTKLEDDKLIQLEMSLDIDDKATVSQFEMYIAK